MINILHLNKINLGKQIIIQKVFIQGNLQEQVNNGPLKINMLQKAIK